MQPPKILQDSQENSCLGVIFPIKASACNFINNELLTQAFSCKFCEISEKDVFIVQPQATASVPNQGAVHNKVDVGDFIQVSIIRLMSDVTE